MGKSKPILSISMLASDRLDTLPRCLESLTPIREAIPSELIIVDTSNNPQVHELIVKYADKVDTFEWCNDFAKARNVGVRMAEGEWFMFLDDDEWFAEPKELIKFFQSGEYKQYGYATHKIRNYYDEDFKRYGYAWVTRLAKISPDFGFRSKIHEYMAPLEGEPKVIYATIYHTGYVYKTEEEKRAHFKRNASLLEKMEEEEPDNLRWKKQMLQEFLTIGDWEGMVRYGKRTLDYLWSTPGTVDASSFGVLHIGYAIALHQTKRYELVEDVYNKARAVVENTLLAKAYMEICMAQSCWELEQYDKAKYHATKYVEYYGIYSQDIEAHYAESTMIFLSSTFDDNRITKAYSIILTEELKSGNVGALYTLYPNLKWDKEYINGYCDVEVYILECLIKNQDYEMLEKVLRDALSTQYIRPRMMAAILEWEQKDRNQFVRMLEVIKTLDVQTWYKHYAQFLTLKEDATKEEVLSIGERFINLTPNLFKIPAEISEVLAKYDVKPADLYMYIDLKKWQEELKDCLEISSMEQVVALQEILQDSVLVNDIRYYYFMMIFAEQKSLLAKKEQFTFDELTDWLAVFSEYTCLCYETLYGDALENTAVEEWPPKYQAARWLQIFFAEVGNDMKSALGCLAKVVGIYPRLADVMQYYLERIQVEILNV